MNKKILEKINKLNKDDSFLVTATIYNKRKKKDMCETLVVSNKFPYQEFESTKQMIAELIDEQSVQQFE